MQIKMIGIVKTNTAEFVTLIDHEDYDILNVYPFVIRKKCNHYVVKEWLSNGYPYVSLTYIPFCND